MTTGFVVGIEMAGDQIEVATQGLAVHLRRPPPVATPAWCTESDERTSPKGASQCIEIERGGLPPTTETTASCGLAV
jgi:hypothetical protein